MRNENQEDCGDSAEMELGFSAFRRSVSDQDSSSQWN